MYTAILAEAYETHPAFPWPQSAAQRLVDRLVTRPDASFQIARCALHLCQTTFTGLVSINVHHALLCADPQLPTCFLPDMSCLTAYDRSLVINKMHAEFHAVTHALNTPSHGRRMFRHPDDTSLDDREADDLFSLYMNRLCVEESPDIEIIECSCPPANVRVLGAVPLQKPLLHLVTEIDNWTLSRLRKEFGPWFLLLENACKK